MMTIQFRQTLISADTSIYYEEDHRYRIENLVNLPSLITHREVTCFAGSAQIILNSQLVVNTK